MRLLKQGNCQLRRLRQYREADTSDAKLSTGQQDWLDLQISRCMVRSDSDFDLVTGFLSCGQDQLLQLRQQYLSATNSQRSIGHYCDDEATRQLFFIASRIRNLRQVNGLDGLAASDVARDQKKDDQ